MSSTTLAYPDTDDSEFLTAKQLAATLKVSVRTLWRLLSAGKIPQPVRIGRSTRWLRRVIQDWIDRGCPGQNN